MNQKEKLILTTLQSKFPLTRYPYRDVARRLGLTEECLLEKISGLKQNGTIRRIGAVTSGRHVGYKSVLISAGVKAGSVPSVARFVNSFANVSHNYLREGEFNLWCTFSAKTQAEIDEFIAALKKRRGVVKVIVLPARKTFKINAEFSL
ncbi:MAG: Lrp/AsnC family transcriptional regulator [Candidatus Omnitrophica bacterium]|nr:Lrp/AsnC family transcriptional regulator [Candidatus Omnitrophota bacterium]